MSDFFPKLPSSSFFFLREMMMMRPFSSSFSSKGFRVRSATRRSCSSSLNSRRQRRGGELGVVFAANAEDTNEFEKEEEKQSLTTTTTTTTVIKSKQRQRDHRKRNRMRNKEKNDEVVREVLERFLQVLKPLFEEEEEKEESSLEQHQLESSFRAMYRRRRRRRNEEEDESFSPPPNPRAMTTTTIIDWSRFPKERRSGAGYRHGEENVGGERAFGNGSRLNRFTKRCARETCWAVAMVVVVVVVVVVVSIAAVVVAVRGVKRRQSWISDAGRGTYS